MCLLLPRTVRAATWRTCLLPITAGLLKGRACENTGHSTGEGPWERNTASVPSSRQQRPLDAPGVPRSRLGRGPGRRKTGSVGLLRSLLPPWPEARRPGGECGGAQLQGVKAKDSSCYRQAGARGVRWCLPLCGHEGTLVLGVYEASRRAACEAPVEQRVQAPGVAGARRPPSQPPPSPGLGAW